MPPVVQKVIKPPNNNGAVLNGSPLPTGYTPSAAWPDDKINMLIYGLPDTGKTTLWSTFPGKILAGICSGTHKSGELRSIDSPAIRQKIEPYILYTDADVKFFSHKAQTGGYSTIVLDHVSGLQDLFLKEILGWEKLPEQRSWKTAEREQYGQAGLQAKEICRKLLDCNANTILIGQETTVDPREYSTSVLAGELKPTIGVDATKSFAKWLNPAVDYNARMFMRHKMTTRIETIAGQKKEITEKSKEMERCLFLAESDLITTKFRLPRGCKRPDVIVNPTYDKILAVLQGRWKDEMNNS